MESWNSALAQHGSSILVLAVFLETVGFPVPAALALLVAGAAAAHGILRLPYAFGTALAAMCVGDTLMFLLGRYTGWWLLGILCRISLNPETCILRSADTFYRRGRTLLVIAKFIPGINTMAPPLAGSMNMRFLTFIRLDFVGAALYIGAYFGIGYVFSGALDAVMRGYHTVGRIAGGFTIALIAAYLVFRAWLWMKGRTLSPVLLVNPHEVARDMAAGAYVYDVRSHGYFDAKAFRIQGSRRLDPNSLHHSDVKLPDDGKVYVYCTCVRQATSARVARELLKNHALDGVRIAVISGGLRAWRKAGLPIEPVPLPEMAALPLFD
jgi:membrane protein DedA with SNARE-associated domain/rhodanese-related sulfurtransferase